MNVARFLRIWCLFLIFCTAAFGQYIWTGMGNGWSNQTIPPGTSSDTWTIPGDTLYQTIPLSANTAVGTISVAPYDDFTIKAGVVTPPPLTLGIYGGITLSSTGFGSLEVGSGINPVLFGSPVLDTGVGQLIISGSMQGSPTSVTLASTSLTGGGGSFIFNNTSTGNTYGGVTYVGAAPGLSMTVSFWNSQPFGTSQVNVTGNTFFVAHGTQALANNFVLNPTSSSDPIVFRSWDAPLTVSGNITLANNVILQSAPALASNKLDSWNLRGSYWLPGPTSRNPIIFTGTISESGGARSLTLGNTGITILQPSAGPNSYTGGTVINGSAIFANSNAIPATGLITVNSAGYAGTPDVTPGAFANFLTKIATGSGGAVGVDTLPGASSTTILTDNINLTGFTNTSIRLGTATRAILQGTITPKGSNYLFGGGGGTLTVQSSLPDIVGPTATQLVLGSGSNSGTFAPLKLWLEGSAGYTGGTQVNNGILVFNNGTFPLTGSFVAAGSVTNVGTSYLGYTQNVDTSESLFLAKFDKANTWGIIGFDTPSSLAMPTTFGSFDPINLTGFNDGVFIGTSTRAYISGNITPTSVTNGSNAANTLRFTAASGGRLDIDSDISGTVGVMIGTPSGGWAYSDGVVAIKPALPIGNSYTGGTIINNTGAITLEVGGVNPLGSGNLTINTGNGVPVGLQASDPGFILSNSIVFNTPLTGQSATTLMLTGTNNFELAGSISGTGSIGIANPTLQTFTLSGGNLGYTGDFSVVNGTLQFTADSAVGLGSIYLQGPGATVAFAGTTANPVVYGLSGDVGNVVVSGGVTLHLDSSYSSLNTGRNGADFGGTITGTGGLAIQGSDGVNNFLSTYLGGNNTFSGGVTISSSAMLGLGHNNAAGTGTVTVNTTPLAGGLALNSGVTLTNNLAMVSGVLAGFGKFAPANISTFTVGTSVGVAPGLPMGSGAIRAGTLTFGSNMVFADGGTFAWTLQDPATLEGASQLIIQGNLDISAAPGGFSLMLLSYDVTGQTEWAPLTWGQSYSFAIVETTGTITNFDATKFSINVAGFQGGLIDASNFTLTADTNTIFLSFTAIPEPSTYALLALGLLPVLAGLRRRRA